MQQYYHNQHKWSYDLIFLFFLTCITCPAPYNIQWGGGGGGRFGGLKGYGDRTGGLQGRACSRTNGGAGSLGGHGGSGVSGCHDGAGVSGGHGGAGSLGGHGGFEDSVGLPRTVADFPQTAG